LDHEICVGHVCRRRGNALAGRLGALPGAAKCRTQASSPLPPGEESPADLPTTVFPHSETSRFWVSGQMNFIEQWHPSFHSPYQGPLSLTPEGEHALSRVFTLFTGVELTSRAEVLFQLESAGGKGIGNGFGLAGFTNLIFSRCFTRSTSGEACMARSTCNTSIFPATTATAVRC